jgi:hypothetical protein
MLLVKNITIDNNQETVSIVCWRLKARCKPLASRQVLPKEVPIHRAAEKGYSLAVSSPLGPSPSLHEGGFGHR